MRHPPGFWSTDGVVPRLLAPAAAMVAGITARRVAKPGFRASVPVICCGNVTVGGAGKTTLALDLARRLQARGVAAHVLLRGYGGRVRDVLRVEPVHPARLVGDEAKLLAAVVPTWVCPDRAAGARAAIADGARVIVMDDGLQNPGLAKDLSLLVIDGGAGFGNGRVLPAGPLREPVAAGAARCQAAILIGADISGAAALLPACLPVLRAHLRPGPAMQALCGRRVLAFAGIGRPEKFFASLRAAGAELVGSVAFPDHHPYREREIERLLARAEALNAVAATTTKDAVRLADAARARVAVADVALAWEDATLIELLLHDSVVGQET